MGLFDKIKKLSDNLSTEKISKKLTSITESIEDKIESVDLNEITSKIGSVAESATDKIKSKVNKFDNTDIKKEADKVTEKLSVKDVYKDEECEENVDIEDINDDKDAHKYEECEEDVDSEDLNDDNDDYEDEEEDEDLDGDEDDESEEDVDSEDLNDDDDEYEDEEAIARRKERNKKIAKGVAKGFAKGAMFMGSYMWAQKHGASSDTSLLHAFSKTKEVDGLFGGKKKDDGEKKEKNQSKNKQIKAIAHYQYIRPKNNRGHNIDVPDIDIPTVSSNGIPTRDEAVKAIMDATGVSESQAASIWNGGDSLAWRKESYTYINDGKRGMTVKCR